MQSLKRHTARQANRILNRRGTFWQAESYDHVVRDEQELERIVEYVIDNPVKAGLIADGLAWPWTYVRCSADS
jgi:REP element-mobilizing transposase RayT